MDRVQKSKLSLYKKTMEVNGRALGQACLRPWSTMHIGLLGDVLDAQVLQGLA